MAIFLWHAALPKQGQTVLAHGVKEFVNELPHEPWALTLVLLACLALAWTVFLAYLLPPHAYDGLYYHLVTVAVWLRTEKIGLVPFHIWSNVYPANAELLFAWLALFLRADTLMDLGQLIFAVGGVLATVGLAREVGISCPGAMAVGSLFFLTPIVLVQVGTNYTDVALASMFLVSFISFFATSGSPTIVMCC